MRRVWLAPSSGSPKKSMRTVLRSDHAIGGECGGGPRERPPPLLLTRPADTKWTDPARMNPHTQSDPARAPSEGADVTKAIRPDTTRTVADVTGLLVELARACKGLSFYAEGHPARADLVDRAWMAWRLEVQRAGALEVECEKEGLRVAGLDDPLTPAAIDELHLALRDHGVETLLLTPDATRESFNAMLELLGQPPDYVAQCGGLAVALAQRSDRGIGVNGQPPGGDLVPGSSDATATSLGSGLLVSTRDLVSRGGASAAGEGAEASDAEAEKPVVDDDPLAAPAGDAEAETMRRDLITLDGLTDEAAYERLALHVLETALAAFGAGRADDGYRATLVLSDHAVGEGGRSARQALLAHETCQALCTGAALDAIIDRACASDVTRSVRPL